MPGVNYSGVAQVFFENSDDLSIALTGIDPGAFRKRDPLVGSGSGGFFLPRSGERVDRSRPTVRRAGSGCEKTSSYLLDMAMSIG